MRHSVTDELACPACRSDLRIDEISSRGDDCVEGFINCEACGRTYPILGGVAIMMNDFAGYASQRAKTLGGWLLESRSDKMKRFLKENARRVRKAPQDRYEAGGAWFAPYLEMRSPHSSVDRHFAGLVRGRNFQDFYSEVAQLVTDKFAAGRTCLEVGCATGNLSTEMTGKLGFVFGVDRSFGLISEARKRNHTKKAEFLVADSLAPPFHGRTLDLAVSLNLLDLVKPEAFLSHIRDLLVDGGSLVLADPYDFRDARGNPCHPTTARVCESFWRKPGLA